MWRRRVWHIVTKVSAVLKTVEGLFCRMSLTMYETTRCHIAKDSSLSFSENSWFEYHVSQMNLLQFSFFFKVYFNIIIVSTPKFPKYLLRLGFATKILLPFFVRFAIAIRLVRFFFLSSGRMLKLLTMQFSPSFSHFSSLRPASF
jgi:hypothetical protein